MTDGAGPAAGDRIYIRDLVVCCTIGIDEQERANKQNVLVQIVLETDLRRAGRTDALEDTIDYRA
jgi:dihydroneopterin aldolase/D-erythro-7,8-dihydroneopterin triphosphate epimerase